MNHNDLVLAAAASPFREMQPHLQPQPQPLSSLPPPSNLLAPPLLPPQQRDADAIAALQSQVAQMQVNIDRLVNCTNANCYVIDLLRQELNIQTQQCTMMQSVLFSHATKLNTLEQTIDRTQSVTKRLVSISPSPNPFAQTAEEITDQSIIDLAQVESLVGRKTARKERDA
jgi:hypothetical protein